MPLQMVTSAFRLWRRRWSSPQQCYVHCLRTSLQSLHLIHSSFSLHKSTTRLQCWRQGLTIQVQQKSWNKLPSANKAENKYTHFRRLGLVFAVEELWESAALDGVKTVVVEPRRIARHDDVMRLFRYVVVIFARIVGDRRLRVGRRRRTS